MTGWSIVGVHSNYNSFMLLQQHIYVNMPTGANELIFSMTRTFS